MTKLKLTNVVERYRSERIDPEAELLDFLPNIKFVPKETEILNSWRRFFRQKKIPYLVTQNGHFVLWKAV